MLSRIVSSFSSYFSFHQRRSVAANLIARENHQRISPISGMPDIGNFESPAKIAVVATAVSASFACLNFSSTKRQKRILTWVKWVWLDAVDHVFVSLKNHHQLSAVLVPNKDASAITAAENIFLTPEISFLYLQRGTSF